MEVLILASGSSGNSALISAGGRSILLDAGISRTAIRRRLEAFGRSLDEIEAVLVTHEHSDHACGLAVLERRHSIPVWATAGTWSRLELRTNAGGELASGRELRFGELRVVPVATSHDASEPVALVFDDGHRRVALCTDTGIVTPLLEQRLGGCSLLLLEANHDPDMLRHGPYPWPLKQRIASRLGHLANHQSQEAAARLLSAELKAVIGLHLSEHNNQPALVDDALKRAVGAAVQVRAVSRRDMLRLVLDRDGLRMEASPIPPSRRAAAGS